MRISSLPYRLGGPKIEPLDKYEIVGFLPGKIPASNCGVCWGILQFMLCIVVVNRGEFVVDCMVNVEYYRTVLWRFK
jgi:hypothetical protein